MVLGLDLRYAVRMLRKSPGFTAVAALSLALGIGANTVIFSLIDEIVLKTLPVKNPEQFGHSTVTGARLLGGQRRCGAEGRHRGRRGSAEALPEREPDWPPALL
jgi:hypothetical protein